MSENLHPYHKMGRMAPPPTDSSDGKGAVKQSSSPKATRPKQNKRKTNRKAEKGGKDHPILVIILLLILFYLLSMGFCAWKFNSLNPVRSLIGIVNVTSGNEPYYQVADIPYQAYVANPSTSVDDLKAKMEADGFEYMELESSENNFIFGRENERIRVVVSGNETFSRWVFSEEAEITILSESQDEN